MKTSIISAVLVVLILSVFATAASAHGRRGYYHARYCAPAVRYYSQPVQVYGGRRMAYYPQRAYSCPPPPPPMYCAPVVRRQRYCYNERPRYDRGYGYGHHNYRR